MPAGLASARSTRQLHFTTGALRLANISARSRNNVARHHS